MLFRLLLIFFCMCQLRLFASSTHPQADDHSDSDALGYNGLALAHNGATSYGLQANGLLYPTLPVHTVSSDTIRSVYAHLSPQSPCTSNPTFLRNVNSERVLPPPRKRGLVRRVKLNLSHAEMPYSEFQWEIIRFGDGRRSGYSVFG